MTRHEFLIWVVPFFTLTTIVGATLSIMRLFSKRSQRQNGDFRNPYVGASGFLAFQANGLWRLLEKGAAFVYIIAALGLLFAISGSLMLWGHP